MECSPYFEKQRFGNFEAFQAAGAEFDVAFTQLDTGPFDGSISTARLPGLRLHTCHYGRKLLHQCTVAKGNVAFAIPLSPATKGVTWLHQDWPRQHIAALNGGEETHLVAVPGFTIAYLIIEASIMEEMVRERSCGLELPASRLLTTRGRLSEMIGLIQNLIANMQPRAGQAKNWNQATARLFNSLLDCLEEAQDPLFGAQRRKFSLLVRRAHELMEDRLNELVSIPQLASELDVSQRTLESAFGDRLSMTPVAYYKRLRLNHAREHLLRESVKNVHDAANIVGFWHMGKFAADYRNLFGELPSETMANRFQSRAS